MTDNYTHFDPLEFTEVNRVQEMLLEPKVKKESLALTLVKLQAEQMPERKRKVS
jgi:hypothetical protein